ncbi:MAG: aspartyl/glutamyl-tRNA amidotransferase subunit A [Acidobacteria bacterium]|nr:aspartyl/glutamyl-tRNA amidotransferase subunit A [Acidobacteriota bacterium]
MISEADLKNLTLARATSLLEKKEISAVELTEAVLRRIERLNERTRAFITVTSDRALERPGAPVSVKDLYDTKGIRTTAGSKVFEHRVPREDATLVKRLDEAGAAIVGKTNLHEFAFGVTTINPHYGTARNPWDLDRICGGSSGGSACAVALFMGLGSLGTDTGGSIRIPAALCGIVGLKPTYGRASLYGVVPLSWSLDHPGPMARTVEDTAILLGIIAGHDPDDAYTEEHDVPRYTGALTGDIKGVRVGLPKTYFYDRLSTEVNSAVANAIKSLEKLGARLEEVDLPSASANREVWTQIASPEVYAFHEPLLAEHAGLYGSQVRARIEAGRHMLSVNYVRAQRTRTIMKEECKAAFDKVDVIVTPTTPIAAPRIDEVEDPWGEDSEPAVAALTRFTRFFNIAGLPAISIPCGFTPESLPIGLQIAGNAFDEATVLRVAHAYEQDARWFERRPTI